MSAASDDDAAALFAAVYAALDDDGPRAVLADWLQERGDPRGDFIALQLAAPPSRDAARRMQALQRAHATHWLGRLASLVPPHEVGWERGFPARARISVKRPSEARRLVELPELATLRALRLGRLGEVAGAELTRRVLSSPALRRVRELEDVPAALVPTLVAAAPPFSLARLGLVDADPAEVERWLAASALGRGLTALLVDSAALGAWFALLGRLPAEAGLRTFVARTRPWEATLTRADGGAWTTLTLAIDGWGESERAAAEALDALPPASLREVELDAPWRTPEIAQAIARVTGA